MDALKKIFFLLILFVIPDFSNGQKVFFEHIPLSENLTNQTVNAIIQDSYGYMWFGTYDRLIKFDGYSAKTYLNDPNDLPEGKKCDVRSFLETVDSALFVGTFSDGLFLYDRAKDRFRNFRHQKDNPASLSSDYILSMYADKKGNIWIGTLKGLDRFDLSSGTFKHYSPFQATSFVAGICEDGRGNLWLYGGNELCKFNPKKNTFDAYIRISGNPKLKDAFLLQGSMICDRNEHLWIGNKEEGLWNYDLRKNQFQRYSKQNQKLKSDMVGCVFEDQEGGIWVGIDGGGLCLYDPLSDNFRLFEHNPNDLSSLSSNAIHSIYESRREQGLLWIGLYMEGVNICKKNKKHFMHTGSNGRNGKTLSHKSVLSFAESPDGKVWIGTDGGGLNLYDPHANTFEYFSEENGKTCANVVKCLLMDSDHNLWAGAYRKGLCRMTFSQGNLGSFTSYRQDFTASGQGLSKDNVWSLTELGNGRIAIGLLTGGVDIFDNQTHRFTHISLDTSRLHAPTAQTLFTDSKNRLWVGTPLDGAFCFNIENKSFIHYTVIKDRIGGLLSNDVRDIFEDSHGNIWFATARGGLSRLDERKNTFENFTVNEGLSTNTIFGILEDDRGNLWLSTEKGIGCFKQKEKQFLNFDAEDGVQGKGFNVGAKLKTTSGYLFFGGVEGFTMFHPDSVQINDIVPPVFITDFKVFNHSLEPDATYNGRKYLEKSISQVSEVFLNYNDIVFSVEFAALSFVSSGKNKYAYKLEGFDKDWTFVDADKRFANYTNLNPGEYVFRVLGSNNDDVWNREGAKLKIIILPPWWMTWWARVLGLFFLVVGIRGVIYLRTKSVKERNMLLEEEVKKQTADLLEKNHQITSINETLEATNKEISRKTSRILEQQDEIIKQKNKLEQLNKTKDKFFSIIAHDLRNPVNALTVLSSTLRKEFKPRREAEKELINNLDVSAQRIKGLVLNLLEWAKSQTESITVDPIKISVRKLIEENIQLHYPQAANKEISIRTDIREGHFIYADYNMASTIIRNILSNSIKYTPKGGEVVISSRQNNDKELVITFEDKGIGMQPEILAKLFRHEYSYSTKGTENETGTGLGMLLTKEFLDLNNGKIEVVSVPNAGSTFIITLPGGSEFVETISSFSLPEKNQVIMPHIPEDPILKEGFKGKRVLVVDDDEQIRNSIKYIISGFLEVSEATDVKTALIACEEISPDLIISDIVMPGESGISFCQTIKSNKNTCHIPVVLLTGQKSEDTHLEGLKAGADAYITKPFDRKIFLSTVNNLLTSLENIKIRFSSDPEILPSDIAQSSFDKDLLMKAILFIEKNISDTSLNGDILAKELGVSKSLLYLKLKNITGQTVNEFIRVIRLKKSTRLLLEGKLTVSQISMEMGFNSSSYYTRSFVQHFGMAPKEYAARNSRNKSK